MTEDGGQPALAFLRRSDPFKSDGCRFEDTKCLVEPNKDCAAMGAIYKITCKTCRNVVDPPIIKEPRNPGGQKLENYVGMTATSVHWRMTSHLKGQKAKSSSNPLYRHDRDHHHGEPQEYLTRILGRERSLLPLNILEALYIEKQSPGTSINSRMESGRGGLVRLTAIR